MKYPFPLMQFVFILLGSVSIINLFQNGIWSNTYFWYSFAPHTYKVVIWSFFAALFLIPKYGSVKGAMLFVLYWCLVEVTYALVFYGVFHFELIRVLLAYLPFYIFCIFLTITVYLLRPRLIIPTNPFKYIPLIINVALTFYSFTNGFIITNSLSVNLREFVQQITGFMFLLWFVDIK